MEISLKLAVIILAAGEGTRMRSDGPKVLHKLAGKPMLAHVLDACAGLRPERLLVVVGHRREEIESFVGGRAQTVRQEEQHGTGHAVLVTEAAMSDYDGPVVVLAGDIPLIQTSTLKGLVDTFMRSGPAATLVTTELNEPYGYGRIIRDDACAVAHVVEEKDATDQERAIKEVNAGIYCFDRRRLFAALAQLKKDNTQSEYYLTDVASILQSRGEAVLAYRVEAEEILGVNSRDQLAEAEEVMQRRLRRRLMDTGVTFILPETSYITAEVKIARDTVVLPNCFLEGATKIGPRCEIGPGARITDSTIGADVKVQYAVVNNCNAEDGTDIGPFCSIRPGTILRRGSRAGTFVEIKKSEVGEGSKVPHLSYIGDAAIGKDVNVGAGSITCNYDGAHKHRTVIEDGAFIGSDTMLIAPVTIGRGAVTGAGSSIAEDVPPDSLAVERSEQRIVPDWAKERRSGKK